MRLLRQTVGALADELHAAGPDEIAYHPILQEHAKIHNRVWRFLERFEGVR